MMIKQRWMRPLVAAGLSAMTTFAAAAPATAASDKPLEVRVAFVLPQDSYLGRSVGYFAEQVLAQSKGRIKVVPLPAATAGPESKNVDDVGKGELEMLVSTTTSVAAKHKPMALWDAPLLFDTREEAHRVLDGAPGQKVLAGLPAIGMVGLCYWESGFRQITNNVRPLTSVDDFEGLRLRVMPTEIAMTAFKRLGVDVKPLPWPEVPAAIKSGAVDGQETPLSAIVAANLHQIQKYATLTNHVYSPLVVGVSKKWWDRLTPADQKILQDAALAARTFEREAANKASVQALAAMKSAGMKVNALEGMARYRISSRLERNVTAIARQAGGDLWLETNAMLHALRKPAGKDSKPAR